MTDDMQRELDTIAATLKEGGYDPYAQLYGFLNTGDETYITRRNDARAKVKTISKDAWAQYVLSIEPNVK